MRDLLWSPMPHYSTGEKVAVYAMAILMHLCWILFVAFCVAKVVACAV